MAKAVAAVLNNSANILFLNIPWPKTKKLFQGINHSALNGLQVLLWRIESKKYLQLLRSRLALGLRASGQGMDGALQHDKARDVAKAGHLRRGVI